MNRPFSPQAMTAFDANGEATTENLHWLRISALQRLLVTSVLVGLIWYMYIGLVLELVNVRVASSPWALVLFSLAAAQILRHGRTVLATLVYTTGTAATIILAYITYWDATILFLLAIPVGTLALLISPGVGFFSALIAGIGVAGLAFAAGQDYMPLTTALLTVVGVFAMAMLIWVATYPLRMMMMWAWRGYERAQAQALDAQEHRAQLMRITYEFEKANRKLNAMTGELERARRAAETARRHKAEFAANISHELRTPLNLIIGFSEMMMVSEQSYGVAMPNVYQSDLEAICRNAQHLSTLIDDVLDLSQVEAGRMGLHKEETTLSTVIDEAISAVATRYASSGLWLRVEAQPELPRLDLDRTRIRQVLINLLNNALRFTSTGGVTVTAQALEKEVRICVIDTGVGIAAEDQVHLFREFYQVGGMTNIAAGGSGLGLAISKQFVEMHGGSMGVHSELGHGATFHFTLPLWSYGVHAHEQADWDTWVRLADNATERTRNLALLSPPGVRATIFERYLDHCRVFAVETTDEVFEVAGQQPLSGVLAVVSSGEAGWMELRRIREALPDLPVLTCTLRGGATLAEMPNVAAYLTKPVSQTQLLAVLEALSETTRNLLIVDDNPEVVRLLTRMTQASSRDYAVSTAQSGAAALDAMRQTAPDAVILDLLMPDVDGYAVLEAMQQDESLRSVPVVIVSARGLEEETLNAGLIGLTRRDGFSVETMIRAIKGNLDALETPAGRQPVQEREEVPVA